VALVPQPKCDSPQRTCSNMRPVTEEMRCYSGSEMRSLSSLALFQAIVYGAQPHRTSQL